MFEDLLCLFSDFYENSALMLEEEGAVIVGLLVGLNVIDANLCVKGEDLDSQVTAILRQRYYIILLYLEMPPDRTKF